jgi:hypothetical protein
VFLKRLGILLLADLLKEDSAPGNDLVTIHVVGVLRPI